MKVLHIGSAGAIMIAYVEFVNQNFPAEEHLFALSAEADHQMPSTSNLLDLSQISRWKAYWLKTKAMYSAEKVILHGLFDPRLFIVLAFQPWLLRKCYWTIWGGDLYDHQLGKKTGKWYMREFFKNRIVKRLGHIITHIEGDYELAQLWYGASAKWHDCFMYPSNLYQDYQLEVTPHEGINILLGNSATPSNNHFEALERLKPFASKNIYIYCPLSYGDMDYAKDVEDFGKMLFGERFVALKQFMAFDKYLDLLAQIDIAIFNHNRQQGLGNITMLLGLKKKVYIKKSITSWGALEKIGVDIHDADSLDGFLNVDKCAQKNAHLISSYFSKESLIAKWNLIFSEVVV